MEKAVWELSVSVLKAPSLRSWVKRKGQGRTQVCHLTPQ